MMKNSNSLNSQILIEIKKNFLKELSSSGVEMSKELGESFIPLLLVCLEKSIVKTVRDFEDREQNTSKE
jgi:hypothetical protein